MRKKQSFGKLKHYTRDILEGKRLDIARTLLTDTPAEGNMMSDKFGLKGMWGKMEVWQAFTEKENIFKNIKDNLV